MFNIVDSNVGRCHPTESVCVRQHFACLYTSITLVRIYRVARQTHAHTSARVNTPTINDDDGAVAMALVCVCALLACAVFRASISKKSIKKTSQHNRRNAEETFRFVTRRRLCCALLQRALLAWSSPLSGIVVCRTQTCPPSTHQYSTHTCSGINSAVCIKHVSFA